MRQWKTSSTRLKKILALGVPYEQAKTASNLSVEDRRAGIRDEVAGNDVVFGVPENTLEVAFIRQHCAGPSLRTAQVCAVPAPTENASEMPETVSGTELPVVVPLPSSPSPLFPQHLIDPSLNNAQLWP